MHPRSEARQETVRDALANARTAGGQTLLDLSARAPLLLVFLRHFG